MATDTPTRPDHDHDHDRDMGPAVGGTGGEPTGTRRSSRALRRTGYVISMLCNAALLYLINVTPGWEAWSWLTSDAGEVVGVVNASLLLSIAVNLGFVVNDHPRLKSLGDAITAAVAFVVLLTIWQAFPFDFGDGRDWTGLVRTVLAVGMVGTAIGTIAAVISIFRPASNSAD